MPEVCTKGWEVFQRCDRGAIALVLGLVVLPLIVATGMAVDYSAAVDERAKLQSTVDSSSKLQDGHA
jgi:Flp pilus assembly protein TadG